ncbi:hypothetical protein HK44_021315 [Pseudomonas fluorescens HK44]|uniref:Uncharacterized protein n=1 Tax=Pseudomonas fluorescens HK44 TaxID=1042209 RepID=A0A010S792_PSEFL|nr:hypothetical protein HK44_021315 [Pseudomonas fluorescens HK44]
MGAYLIYMEGRGVFHNLDTEFFRSATKGSDGAKWQGITVVFYPDSTYYMPRYAGDDLKNLLAIDKQLMIKSKSLNLLDALPTFLQLVGIFRQLELTAGHKPAVVVDQISQTMPKLT